MGKKIYSVGEITQTIKFILEDSLPVVWIEGEVSNFKSHYSGHYYFSLKDETAQISAVMWQSRTKAVDFQLADGMLLRVLGNIRVYEKSGRYQIDCLEIKPAGAGSLQKAFDELKQKLYVEGLFNVDFKQSLPQYPESIALITSPTGAAIQDMINVLNRRAPYVKIFIRATQVQGAEAAKDISQAIQEVNNYGNIDLIILGRGGGSIEDLWAFNEEVVARSIFKSNIPVISAVGHEIDYTIADFVADLRAPTPSAAAELAVNDQAELSNTLLGIKTQIKNLMENKILDFYHKVNALKNSYGLRRAEDIIHQYMQHIDNLSLNLLKAYRNLLTLHNRKVESLEKQLKNLNPDDILSRGYSITYYAGKVLKDVSLLSEKDKLITKLSSGEVTSIVKQVKNMEKI